RRGSRGGDRGGDARLVPCARPPGAYSAARIAARKGGPSSMRGGRSDTTSWSDGLAALSSSSVSAQQIKGRFKDRLPYRLALSISLRALLLSTLRAPEPRQGRDV